MGDDAPVPGCCAVTGPAILDSASCRVVLWLPGSLSVGVETPQVSGSPRRGAWSRRELLAGGARQCRSD